jgi:UDP-N-acetylglucosamine--N-acetylmuramyl-(pentapeptide) pyrophosphoryl-undecaprenol N-acetylglucosamine transferase
MGGKQGSHPLNRFIFHNLPSLIKHYNLIHQTGTSSLTGDYDQAVALKDGLRTAAENYLPLGYISEAEIGTYLRSSNFYLGRSGAHITYELAVLGIPAVLVPYLHTHDHEQLKNAQFLVASGLGEIMPQAKLSLDHLTACLSRLKDKQVTPLALPLDAGAILVDDFLKDLSGD